VTIQPQHAFDQPWHARAFAMVVELHERGLFTWQDWAATLAASIAADPDRDYYESWLDALEAITTRDDLLDRASIVATQAEWLRAAARTPHGATIELPTTDDRVDLQSPGD
jgi:nitrile hydratase accessory protein